MKKIPTLSRPSPLIFHQTALQDRSSRSIPEVWRIYKLYNLSFFHTNRSIY